MNGHMNNTRYVDVICDALPWSVWDTAQLRDLRIFYHREVPRGESFALSCLQTEDNRWYFSGERDSKSAFEAEMVFG